MKPPYDNAPAGRARALKTPTKDPNDLQAQIASAGNGGPWAKCPCRHCDWQSLDPRRDSLPLGSFDEEIERLRDLLAQPHLARKPARWRTLDAQRWIAFERVLVAAHNECRPLVTVAEVAFGMVAQAADTRRPFDFDAECAGFLLDGIYERCRGYWGRAS